MAMATLEAEMATRWTRQFASRKNIQRSRYLLEWEDEISPTDVARGQWHLIYLGTLETLGDDEPAGLLDRAGARGSILPIAGEHHADDPGAVDGRGGSEQHIGGGTAEVDPLGIGQAEHAIRAQQHMPVGWSDVNRARCQPDALLGGSYVQGGVPSKDRRQPTGLASQHVLADQDRQREVDGQRGNQREQRLDASGGRRDHHDIERRTLSRAAKTSGNLRITRSWSRTRDVQCHIACIDF